MTDRTVRKQRYLAWLIAALMTAGMFAVILRFGDLRFLVNDDQVIQQVVNGYSGGVTGSFCVLVHWLIMEPLRWLSRMDPSRPWFAYMQLFIMFLSLTACHAAVMQVFIRERRPLWAGFLAASLLIVCIGAKYTATPTYTITAGLAATAAVMLIMGMDPEHQTPAGIFASLMGATVFAALSYAIRDIMMFITLPYCAIALMWMALRHYRGQRSPKPLLAAAGVVILVFAFLLLSRGAEISMKGLEDAAAWQKARIDLMDYPGIERLTDEQLAQAGWSRTTLDMMKGFFYLDPAVTTESMQYLIGEIREMNRQPLRNKLAFLGRGERPFASCFMITFTVLWESEITVKYRNLSLIC